MTQQTLFRYMAITDQTRCPEPVPDRLNRLLKLGVPSVQIRDKSKNDAARQQWIDGINKKYRSKILFNGRADFVLLNDLGGVHAPERSLPIDSLRKLIGTDKLIGRSVHNLENALKAQSNAVDYLLFGPVFTTPSKPDFPDHRLPQLDLLDNICRSCDIPVLALGGVTVPRIKSCLEAGAWGVAGISQLFGSDNPESIWMDTQKVFNEYGIDNL